LFRWAERYRLSGEQTTKFYDWDQHLADEGYLVLAGKERKLEEADVIRDVLEKNFKRKVDPSNLFSLHEKTSTVTRDVLETVMNSNLPEFSHIVWTYPMRRLAVLIGNSMKFKEPILLVGETGVGKTTVVQLLSELQNRKLFSINCHMNSEGSDFLGGLRPVRDHTEQVYETRKINIIESFGN
jgi:midasin